MDDLIKLKSRLLERISDKPTWGRQMVKTMIEEEYTKILEENIKNQGQSTDK